MWRLIYDEIEQPRSNLINLIGTRRKKFTLTATVPDERFTITHNRQLKFC